MKMLSLAFVAALAAASLAAPSVANARPGWDKHHHRHCWTEWHHHHKVTRCR
ncbi:MAG TPA: hypothetical protein VF481_09840 [Novosphingobium sp.]